MITLHGVGDSVMDGHVGVKEKGLIASCSVVLPYIAQNH